MNNADPTANRPQPIAPQDLSAMIAAAAHAAETIAPDSPADTDRNYTGRTITDWAAF